jgi:hypothetical protein
LLLQVCLCEHSVLTLLHVLILVVGQHLLLREECVLLVLEGLLQPLNLCIERYSAVRLQAVARIAAGAAAGTVAGAAPQVRRVNQMLHCSHLGRHGALPSGYSAVRELGRLLGGFHHWESSLRGAPLPAVTER